MAIYTNNKTRLSNRILCICRGTDVCSRTVGRVLYSKKKMDPFDIGKYHRPTFRPQKEI